MMAVLSGARASIGSLKDKFAALFANGTIPFLKEFLIKSTPIGIVGLGGVHEAANGGTAFDFQIFGTSGRDVPLHNAAERCSAAFRTNNARAVAGSSGCSASRFLPWAARKFRCLLCFKAKIDV